MVTLAMQGGDSRCPTFAKHAKTPVLADSAGFSLIKRELSFRASPCFKTLPGGGYVQLFLTEMLRQQPVSEGEPLAESGSSFYN
jgi:hypothetical protein